MIDSTFGDINTLFVLSFKNGGNDPTRKSFVKYFMPLVEIQDDLNKDLKTINEWAFQWKNELY